MAPVCPVCRRNKSPDSLLSLGAVMKQTGDLIIEGVLVCTNRSCMSEFPIIDGIPIVMADLRQYISRNYQWIMNRTDLSDVTESLIGDCCGPESTYDAQRRYLSSYAFDHYGGMNPYQEDPSSVVPGSILHLVREGLNRAGSGISAPVLDMGCAVGRSAFELAENSDDIVLGVDLNFSMLKTAQTILREGIVRYPLRRGGVVYDRREFPVTFKNAEQVDFWCCDVAGLPFADNTFGLAASFNVIDCVASPYGHLVELARVLLPAPHGKAIITTPYDWSASATAIEAWIGGHSQRSETRGDSPGLVRSLLSSGEFPQSIDGARIISETESIPWPVRIHDRSVVQYDVHLIAAEFYDQKVKSPQKEV